MSAPAVAVSPDGSKFATAWKDVRTGENKVYWSVSESPDITSDAPIRKTLFGEQNHPSIAIDTSGTVWVAWEDSQPTGQQIWIRSSADSDKGTAISDRSEGASFPVVATNAGMVAVVYEAEKDGESTVMFRRIPPTK